MVNDFLAAGDPVISVDTMKKELVGNYKNGGREWQPRGEPVEVDVHDFPDPAVGKAIPYGGHVVPGATHLASSSLVVSRTRDRTCTIVVWLGLGRGWTAP